MYKRLLMGVFVGVLAVGFTAPSAFAFRCPKLIGAGRRLAKTYFFDTAQASKLLNEAEVAHKGATSTKGHITAMQKATDAIAILTQ